MGRKPNVISQKRLATERRIIDAAGMILTRDGFKGFGINALAREAMVSKKLIYNYFGKMERLLRRLISEFDFWLHLEEMEELRNFVQGDRDSMRAAVAGILKKHFEYFRTNKYMQETILWQLSEKQEVIDSLCHSKEILGNELFAAIEALPQKCFAHLRFVFALAIYGTYAIVLHRKNNTSTICGIDLNLPEDQEALMSTIDYLVDKAFEAC